MNYIEVDELLNKQIDVYQDIKTSIEGKNKSIIANDIDSLRVFDNKIEELTQKAKSIQTLHQNKTLKELINQITNKEEQNILNKKRTFLKSIISNIQTQHYANKKLLKHSLVLVESSINMISKALVPESSAYGSTGKLKTKDNALYSSIIKEA